MNTLKKKHSIILDLYHTTVSYFISLTGGYNFQKVTQHQCDKI